MRKFFKKYLMCLAIATAMLIGLVCNVYADDEKQVLKDYEYEIVDSKAVITKYVGSEKNISIPAEITGYPVTEIGDNAFQNCNTLERVKILANVNQISDYAFSDCINLKSVEIPESVANIGDFSFSNCIKLKSVEIPEGVVSIGCYTFNKCKSLKSVKIPNRTKIIGIGCYSKCYRLKSVIIPESVNTIGDYAFENCYNLKSIQKPDNIRNMGVEVFDSNKDFIAEEKESLKPEVYLYVDNYKVLTSPFEEITIKWKTKNVNKMWFIGFEVPPEADPFPLSGEISGWPEKTYTQKINAYGSEGSIVTKCITIFVDQENSKW